MNSTIGFHLSFLVEAEYAGIVVVSRTKPFVPRPAWTHTFPYFSKIMVTSSAVSRSSQLLTNIACVVCVNILHTHTHTHTGLKGRAREARGDARVRGTHDAQDARNTNLDARVRGMQGNINLDARLRGTQDACNTRVCTGASVSRVSRGATRTRSLACTDSSKELFEEV